jgi:flagellar transcriptional activator FlhC
MSVRSVFGDARQILLASELIRLGARLQLLESETTLSRERLLKLYKELRGVSPPKGMLPFSTDWFISWQPNIHASVFMGIYRYLLDHARLNGIDAVIKAYRLYLEQMPPSPSEQPVLSLTRAWTLIRFLITACYRFSVVIFVTASLLVTHFSQNVARGVAYATRQPAREKRSALITSQSWIALRFREAIGDGPHSG